MKKSAKSPELIYRQILHSLRFRSYAKYHPTHGQTWKKWAIKHSNEMISFWSKQSPTAARNAMTTYLNS